MADDADRAEERIEQVVSDGIQAARNAQGLKPVGVCYYCGALVQPWKLFCCSGCTTDYEWLESRKRANK